MTATLARNLSTSARRLGQVLASTLLLLACAGAVPVNSERAFNRAPAERLFQVGFGSIANRYMEPITVDEVATAGMQGLARLDPALSVVRTGKVVQLRASERVVASVDEPTEIGSAAAWAKVTASVIEAGRVNSHWVQNASSESIYQVVFENALTKLDGYSRYLGIDRARDERASREGFDGIGIAIEEANGLVRVVNVYAETPAAKAGIKEGDVIVAVDGKSTAGLGVRDVTVLLRGPSGSSTRLHVRRDNIELKDAIEVARAHIVLPTVTVKRDGDIAIIKLSGFNQQSAARLEDTLRRLVRDGDSAPRGLVLDMRGNPGGLLDQSIAIADLFLDDGPILSARGRSPESMQSYTASGRDVTGDLPLVVLLNGSSASASEVVAAALQDRGRALVVGTNSYGKGSIQTVVTLPNDGELTITWSRFFAPSGYALQNLGVLPNVCTSGRLSDTATLVAKTADDAAARRKDALDWRNASVQQDKGARTRLRNLCPADTAAREVDIDVARVLLHDALVYTRIKDATVSAAALIKPPTP